MNAYDRFAAAAGHPITELEALGVDAALQAPETPDPDEWFEDACARYIAATGRIICRPPRRGAWRPSWG